MHDVIVTGSGPLGAVVARRCREGRASVLLIEEGGPISEPAGTHVRNASRFTDNPDSYLPAIAPFLSYFNNSVGDSGLPGACVTSAYGGQGVLWTNNCPRPTPGLELDDQLSANHWSYLLDVPRAIWASRQISSIPPCGSGKSRSAFRHSWLTRDDPSSHKRLQGTWPAPPTAAFTGMRP